MKDSPGKVFDSTIEIINAEILTREIDGIKSRLRKYSTESEKLFLMIGSSLQKYHTASRELTQTATNISVNITNEILQKGTDELDSELNCIIDFLSKSSEEIKSDKEIVLSTLVKLNSLSSEIKGFEKIIKRLSMLGISTKIESARLGMEDEGFVALAENVDKLGSIIHDKISVVTRKSVFLEKELTNTLDELKYLGTEHEKQSKIIMNNAVASIDNFKQKQISSSNNVNGISDRSVMVSNNISDIVSSLQFHDITRQKIEHVAEALSDLTEKDHTYSAAGIKAVDPFFIKNVLELQAVQLNNAIKEFVMALNNIEAKLKSVGQIIEEIFEKSLMNICNSENEGTGGLNKIEEELKGISNGLLENIRISDALEPSIRSIIEIVDDLLKYVAEIEEVGDEIEIIAINARVKAARFGNSGAALGVLAESIQKLSGEAKVQTLETSRILTELGEESRKLGVSLKNVEKNTDRHSIENTVDNINMLIVSMKKVESESCGLIGEMKTSVKYLQNELLETANNIRENNTADESIYPVVCMLNEISGEISNYMPAGESENKIENTKLLMNKYTMHTEREVHKNFTGETGCGSPEINHFPHAVDNSFGDNVELF